MMKNAVGRLLLFGPLYTSHDSYLCILRYAMHFIMDVSPTIPAYDMESTHMEYYPGTIALVSAEQCGQVHVLSQKLLTSWSRWVDHAGVLKST